MNYFTAAEAANLFRVSALDKSKKSFTKFALMAILGGAFIALGGLLTVMVAGATIQIDGGLVSGLL
jgi:formate/nitrite transporter FocA (FNT family)